MSKLFNSLKEKLAGINEEDSADELEWIDLEEDDFEDDDDIDDEDIDDEDYEDDESEDDEDYEDEDSEDDEDYEDEEDDEDSEDDENYEDDDSEDSEDDEDYEDEEDDDPEEDEDYEDEDDDDPEDDEDYEDEDDDSEDDDEDDEYYEEVRGIKGFFINAWDKIRGLSTVDHVVIVTGVIVLVLSIVTGSLYAGAKLTEKEVATFAEIGTEAEGITVIGESGLLAIADAKAAKLIAAEVEEEVVEETEGAVEIKLNLTTIQKDLKIKFTNASTGKLIPDVAFEVEVSDPKGKTYTLKDEDKDGIIHQKDIAGGKYSIVITNPKDGEEFKVSSAAESITVSDTIAYKKVDVSDEVKTEAQVNVAVEDTAVNQTVVESTNTDTVEWVESTKTPIAGTESSSYEEVAKNDTNVTNPYAKAEFRRFVEGDGTATEAPTEAPTEKPTEAPTEKPTEAPTEVPTEKPTEKPTEAPTTPPTATPVAPTPTHTPTMAPSATPTAAASATPSATPSASPTAKPSATPTATPANAGTALKDKNGHQLYVHENGKYREATYADYAKFDKFYRQKTTAQYTYTGWQTIDGKTYFYDKNGNYVTGDQVIQGAKYSFASDGSLNTSSGHMGIDVSKWNGNIDWAAVKNSGVSYVIIRCGYRGSTTGALIEDPKFRSNIQGATNAGLKVGVYFFTQAVSEAEAVEEASMTLSLIKSYKISYPVFLDVESAGGRADGISRDTRTAVCKAFCQTIQNSGYTAGIYANKTWFTSYMNAGSLTSYKLWLAQYAATPTYTATKYDLWQYSSKGSVAGISGNVDMNISYMGY